MPGRKYSAGSSYRYGFNGKENDNDVKNVVGGQQDYGMRIYDPRVGKFLSVDPLTKQYPHYTPYSFAGNKPVSFIDRDGEEEGSLEIYTRRREEAYLKGKISASEYKAQIQASGLGGLIGTAITFDAFVTHGYITSFLFTQNILGHLYHNGTKNPAEQKKRADDLTNDLVGLASGYVLGKAINLTTKVLTAAGKAVYKTFSSSSVRFSQSSVNGLEEIVTSMKTNGWKGEPIDIVKMKDDIYTTVDNTRLLAAQKAGIDVKAVAHNYDDVIPEEMAKRFLNKQGEAPKTWGEAVENRIKNQNKQFRTNNENGSFNAPKDNTATKTETGGG